MALWFCDIQKQGHGNIWTNRYVLESNTLSEAQAAGMIIVGYEKAVHKDSVGFTKMRVSDMVPDTDNYVVTSLSGAGSIVYDGNALPLFNVVRVDFNTGSGRPSRKYLRLPLTEADVIAGNLTTSAQSAIENAYAIPLAGFLPYVDIDGEQLTSAAVKLPVGMRQLRRGSKRKTESILP